MDTRCVAGSVGWFGSGFPCVTTLSLAHLNSFCFCMSLGRNSKPLWPWLEVVCFGLVAKCWSLIVFLCPIQMILLCVVVEWHYCCLIQYRENEVSKDCIFMAIERISCANWQRIVHCHQNSPTSKYFVWWRIHYRSDLCFFVIQAGVRTAPPPLQMFHVAQKAHTDRILWKSYLRC